MAQVDPIDQETNQRCGSYLLKIPEVHGERDLAPGMNESTAGFILKQIMRIQ